MNPESPLEIVPFEPSLSVACERIFQAPQVIRHPAPAEAYIRNLPRLTSFVVRLHGVIVGFVALEQHLPESAENHVLVVHPEHHRQGIGRSSWRIRRDGWARHFPDAWIQAGRFAGTPRTETDNSRTLKFTSHGVESE